MKNSAVLIALLAMAVAVASCTPAEKTETGEEAVAEVTELTNFDQKAHYAVGMDIHANLGRMEADLDEDALVRGLAAALTGGEFEVTEEEAEQLRVEFGRMMMDRRQQGATTDAPPTIDASTSYAVGMDIGTRLSAMPTELESAHLLQGLRDALAGGECLLSEEESAEVMAEFRQQMMTAEQERRQEQGAKNQEEGEAFLAENKGKEGVETTASGLQYKILVAGTGPSPTPSDRVKVHYRGTLIDGTEFDSSFSRGEPAVFGVSQVIPGWVEALQLMKVGGKWQLFIPSDIAYGERGAGQMIGPNATLIFEVELLSIEE